MNYFTVGFEDDTAIFECPNCESEDCVRSSDVCLYDKLDKEDEWTAEVEYAGELEYKVISMEEA